ncbi:hypothetical protein [Marinomonas transparens]|uniref:Glycoside hydrolase 123 C-terminal domain-containing protein n=1 Tax=Marinomonas transparens TaxID=2795388 RepID=A0A934N2V0_9GAMM|nr:hypothetical protein [Marinomonas transparens]MBJ7538253.1 hypothetical protein [Marinomonas transparens]
MIRTSSYLKKLWGSVIYALLSPALWATDTIEAASDTATTPVSYSLNISSPKTNWSFGNGLVSGKQLEVSGRVKEGVARVLVRIDHAKSHHYFSRFNHEQLLHAGPFTFYIDLDRLKTAHNQDFSAEEIRRIYLSPLTGKLDIQQVKILAKPKAPNAIRGWDFSPILAQSAWGFYSVTPDSTWQSIGGHSNTKPKQPILQGSLRGRDRPYHDELIRDGIEGLKQVILPLENGLWRVTLWTQDIGEWEYLPHPLERQITLNKQRILDESLSAESWRKQYYFQPLGLQHSDILAYQQGDVEPIHQAFWRQIGRKRGDPIDAIVEITDGQLNITLESPSPAGLFLSAVIATPWNHQAEQHLATFDQLREQAFKQRWPIVAQPNLSLEALTDVIKWGQDTPLIAQGELISLQVTIPQNMGALKQFILPLSNVFWFKQTPRLSRVGGQENALTLKSQLSSFDPHEKAPSQDEVWIIIGEVSKNTHAPTLAKGKLIFEQGELSTTFIPLNMTLPQAQQPVGLYLDYAPHLSWFSSQDAEQQAKQDYRFFKQFGLTGVAPALPTPNTSSESIQGFKRAAQLPLLTGLLPPFPAYTPLKRMLTQPLPELLETLAALNSLDSILLWSLGDEPGLFPDLDKKLMALNTKLAKSRPSLQRYAQLNHKQHDKLAAQFPHLLINQGYDLSASRFADLQTQGSDYYLYNLDNLRAAAGHYLWRSKAKGFWQWHARMPTAHPYDPTDGREDDVQFLMPTEHHGKQIIIRSDLLSLRTGINDLRWLTWLSQNAKKHIDFAILEQEIAQSISMSYKNNPFKNNDLNINIAKIKRLAQRLQLPQ